jgi:hypothetical protein
MTPQKQNPERVQSRGRGSGLLTGRPIGAHPPAPNWIPTCNAGAARHVGAVQRRASAQAPARTCGACPTWRRGAACGELAATGIP